MVSGESVLLMMAVLLVIMIIKECEYRLTRSIFPHNING